MRKVWANVAFRLALGYAVLATLSMSVIATVFYFGTVGVLARDTDAKLQALSIRLAEHFRSRGTEWLREEIEHLLADGIEQDTEVYLLVAPDGRKLAGNLAGWTPRASESGRLGDRGVIRDGRSSISRILPLMLPDGAMLVVGRDLHDRLEIETLVWRALAIGGLCAVLLATLGAVLFRRQLEARIAAIRHTAREIEAGDLSRRIPVTGIDDEFGRLGSDINRMLDWIEHLMDGVRHVSNAIAHDLRTPLGRIRAQLDEALHPGHRAARLPATARSAINQIDELIGVFDRLLQIAEAESGTRRQSFAPVRLITVAADIVELYDAEAEERGIRLVSELDDAAATLGDRALLASAVANLVDNALKYTGYGATVRVLASRGHDSVSIIVEDNGPGIPDGERSRVVERFYRVDHSRSVPGNGLGLSIVSAIAALHWGSLRLEDAAPGLRAHIVLPRTELLPSASASDDLLVPVAAAPDR
jgi:signal transduction histidine kinase